MTFPLLNHEHDYKLTSHWINLCLCIVIIIASDIISQNSFIASISGTLFVRIIIGKEEQTLTNYYVLILRDLYLTSFKVHEQYSKVLLQFVWSFMCREMISGVNKLKIPIH